MQIWTPLSCLNSVKFLHLWDWAQSLQLNIRHFMSFLPTLWTHCSLHASYLMIQLHRQQTSLFLPCDSVHSVSCSWYDFLPSTAHVLFDLYFARFWPKSRQTIIFTGKSLAAFWKLAERPHLLPLAQFLLFPLDWVYFLYSGKSLDFLWVRILSYLEATVPPKSRKQ